MENDKLLNTLKTYYIISIPGKNICTIKYTTSVLKNEFKL